jgi:hypothetical protein
MASNKKNPSSQLKYFEKIKNLVINPSTRSTRQMKTQIDTTQPKEKTKTKNQQK